VNSTLPPEQRPVRLADSGPDDLPRVGGKAMGLARLARLGLPVPAAVVAPVACFDAWAAADRGGGPDGSRALAVALLAHMAPGLLAVRSSAADEDGDRDSHAGQFETVLGVEPTPEALRDAVLRCWRSGLAPAARAYRVARGLPPLPRMAVVVQQMVDARVAGVLFTINPATGSWSEMTIEAVWGLGEAAVSGRTPPEFHRVARPRSLPGALLPGPLRRLQARVEVRPIERQHHDQWTALRAIPGGISEEPVPPERARAPKLAPADVERLGRLGLRVERRLGGPQDIEWAMDPGGGLQVLQARPITTGRDVRPAGEVVWTRRFFGERWTLPATPLGWSLIGGLIDRMIDHPELSRRLLGGGPPTQLVRFTPYVNATIFRHLAFKLPGAAPPAFLIELLPPEEEQAWKRRRAQPPDLRVYGAVLQTTVAERRWRRFRWNPVRNEAHWEDWRRALEAALPELEAPARGRDEVRARLSRCRDLAEAYLKVHICSLLFAHLWGDLARSALPDGDADALLRPLAPTETVRAARDLGRAGRGELSFGTLLAHHGHRAECSWELFAPRWAEDPAMLEALARASGGGPDPVPAALRACADADARAAALPAGLRPIVWLARRYLQLREDQRYHFDRLLWPWKRLWLWMEAEEGLQLRFLELAEVEALWSGALSRAAAGGLVDRRSSAWAEERRRQAAGDLPPVFLRGDGAEPPSGGRLQGLGISAGARRGPVRIVRSLADGARLQPGDILVARTTDPGWTPLFLRAGAVVLELGGMLSHAAVVARELGVPAVVNVEGACSRLHDGQVVLVDGSRGIVWSP
jgi:pyruvate,water dikinase